MLARRLSLPAISAGFIAVTIGYTSSAAIVWQAALAVGASPAQAAGWLCALGLAMGVSTLGLSLHYKAPVLTAWSTPGAALLATSAHVTPGEAVAVFICAGALSALCGISGLFGRLMQAIPSGLAAAMLAGILLHYCLTVFRVLPDNPLLVGCMLAAWLLCRRRWPRLALIATLVTGALVAWGLGAVHFTAPAHGAALLTLTAPVFTPSVLIGLGIPFFLVNMASQNAPGFATLRAAGYPVPAAGPVAVTGGLSALLAPLGVFSVCIAAISAAVCQGEEAGPDPRQRWKASAAAGVFYLLAGLSGGAIASLLLAFPLAFIQVLAGLALLNTFSASLSQALHDGGQRDAAVITLLVTASGVSAWGVSSAFWGLVAGAVVHRVLRRGAGAQLAGGHPEAGLNPVAEVAGRAETAAQGNLGERQPGGSQ